MAYQKPILVPTTNMLVGNGKRHREDIFPVEKEPLTCVEVFVTSTAKFAEGAFTGE